MHILYYIILYYIILFYFISYYIILYYIISYHIILYYIILYCIISYHIILYYIILYYIYLNLLKLLTFVISFYILINWCFLFKSCRRQGSKVQPYKETKLLAEHPQNEFQWDTLPETNNSHAENWWLVQIADEISFLLESAYFQGRLLLVLGSVVGIKTRFFGSKNV